MRYIRPMLYHFKIHKEGNGFWAECIELPECMTTGNNKEELLVNMKLALNEYFQESGRIFRYVPPPAAFIKVSRSVVEIAVDPSVVRKEQGRVAYIMAGSDGGMMTMDGQS